MTPIPEVEVPVMPRCSTKYPSEDSHSLDL